MRRSDSRVHALAAVCVFAAACAAPPESSPRVSPASPTQSADVDRYLLTDAAPTAPGSPRIATQSLSFAAQPGWRSVPTPAGIDVPIELTLERTGSAVFIFAMTRVASGDSLDDATARMRAKARDPKTVFDEHRFFLDEESLTPASLMRSQSDAKTTWTITAISGERMLVAFAAGDELGSHEAETLSMLRSVRFVEAAKRP
jgi:hypothetical protein